MPGDYQDWIGNMGASNALLTLLVLGVAIFLLLYGLCIWDRPDSPPDQK